MLLLNFVRPDTRYKFSSSSGNVSMTISNLAKPEILQSLLKGKSMNSRIIDQSSNRAMMHIFYPVEFTLTKVRMLNWNKDNANKSLFMLLFFIIHLRPNLYCFYHRKLLSSFIMITFSKYLSNQDICEYINRKYRHRSEK